MQLIAHRGYSAIAPENTLAAFKAAVEAGAAGVEFDVRLSADGVPVVLHDPSLERTTDGCGPVSGIEAVALRSLDAGSWFAAEFAAESVPTLADVLTLLAPSSLRLFPEVKQADGWPSVAIASLLAQLDGTWRDRAVVASFNYEFLQKLRGRAPWVALGFNIARPDEFVPALQSAVRVGNAVLMCAYDILLSDLSRIAEAATAGVEIVAWTVDDRAIATQLDALGIHKIISNTLLME
ncbi:glycerophosphoryl diester phosphodiesterase [Rubidibacter lacunae KORDI 51-2]|uniref:Glycerophosphoryl diester phosphodiesterase n=1 Tax=Rubidibacter lacunae KORDI 51-2 TaxID=582515 RepID=U5DHL5_9CHRO|nr:glycerophosphodiester phosphodiesterase family protein [Rubidibacter lacunae]ERN41106.1 glycerophosphoryl diester phosphodiesterase [Rubidibacter lacunae KORDI 51-2]